MNKLYNDTAVQAIANAIRAKNGSSDTYTIAEMSTALNDLSYYAKPIISNVPLATFEADGLPLNALKVSVEAKQEGSGTPSPDNIRPISGWSEVKVSDVDDVDNPTVTQTTTISLPQTVYGGEVDVVNGTSGNKLTHGYVDLGTLNWTRGETPNNHWRFVANLSDIKIASSASDIPNMMCSDYQTISPNSSYTGTQGITNNAFTANVIVCDMNYTDAASFKTAMSGVQLVYELATPTTFETQPTPIKSLNGQNNLSVDSGDVIELEYFKEV